jgi:hypothetical protein
MCQRLILLWSNLSRTAKVGNFEQTANVRVSDHIGGHGMIFLSRRSKAPAPQGGPRPPRWVSFRCADAMIEGNRLMNGRRAFSFVSSLG